MRDGRSGAARGRLAPTETETGGARSSPEHDADPSRTGPGSLAARAALLVRTAWRLVVIVHRLLPLIVAFARDRRRYVLAGPPRPTTPIARRRRARFLREALVDLGPTFVKLGQLLSTRPDAVPPEYVAILSTLQDRVPPADWHDVERVIAAAVGPVDAAFDAFDRVPVSGASLGQVHEATLDGERVAVKVLRPGVRERVAVDLRVIRLLLAVWQALIPAEQARTFQRVFDEFALTIREEMDYDHEAAMLREIGANLRDDEGVEVPAVVDRRSTDRVLTMTHVPGTKVTDVGALDDLGVDRGALARRLLATYTEMVLVDGVFQADPHPGNIAVRPDGTVVLYDFGMCGRLDAATRSRLGSFYAGLATGDVDALVAALEGMGAVAPDADPADLRRLLAAALADLHGEPGEAGPGGLVTDDGPGDATRAEAGPGDVTGSHAPGGATSHREVADAVAGIDLYHFPLVLPRELALLVRLGTVLDGVVRTVDPDVDVAAVLAGYGAG